MAPWLIFPVRLLGLAAAGFALGAGWKLGGHLLDVVAGKKDLLWPKSGEQGSAASGNEALWKRRFSKVGED